MEQEFSEAAFKLATSILKSFKGDFAKSTKFCNEMASLVESNDSGFLEFMTDPNNIKRVASMAKMFGL